MTDHAPLSRPPKTDHDFRNAAILFSGGPAPAANAVISTCAVSFLRNDIGVVGVRYGYSHLMEYSPENALVEGEHYFRITHSHLKRTRNQSGIILGTARANPGKFISSPSHLSDPDRVAPMKTTYEALCSLEVDALVSIGGDDTLKTANKFKLYQDTLPEGSHRIPVVHVPKTIDNDYTGIDFTFGYFTAVEFLAGEIRNLLADAESSRSYFVVETMGRSAGWLAYGAAIASEASLVISVEDITGRYAVTETTTDPETGESRNATKMDIDQVIARIVRTMRVREEEEGKLYGVIVVAEGLAEFFSEAQLKDVPRDEHGHISVAHLDLAKTFSRLVSAEYARQTGKSKKVTGVQLGYESRCSRPQAFDVMLGSQLGVGAYRALVEDKQDGVMISVAGQLSLHNVPFSDLVDPETLVTKVRFVEPGSDFHRLARFLETYVNE